MRTSVGALRLWKSLARCHHARRLSTLSPDIRLPTLSDLCLNDGDNVVVAMSGGVDSSVTLQLLSRLPLNLSVLFMRNWDSLLSESDPDEPQHLSLAYNGEGARTSPCSWEKDWNDVQSVAEHVGVPGDKVRLVDLSREYWSRVFEPSVAVWDAGQTPNPDVWCNREIKFGALMQHIPDGHYLATGHYARVKRAQGRASLHRALDANKDQTYYLSQVDETRLARAVFPLAGIPKAHVRDLARHSALPTAERAESMGVCFIGERGKFGDFVSQYTSPPTPGWFVDLEGKRIAQHRGLCYYTIGQRPGIGGLQGRWFVARKGCGEDGNDIVLVPGSTHPALQCSELWSGDFNWIARAPPHGAKDGLEVLVQVRHRMAPVRATATTTDDHRVHVVFAVPITAVASGQIVGLWSGDECLGSGVISETKTVA